MTNIPGDIAISEFDYPLPDNRIAKFPLKERDKCKLLIYKDKQISEDIFSNIGKQLPDDGIMIVNNTKVIPARLEFFTHNGARIEIFCLEPHTPADYDTNFASKDSCMWRCLAGNLKRWKNFNLSRTLPCNGGETVLTAEKIEVAGGEIVAKFSWTGGYSFSEIIDAAGSIPIPPYLNRKAEESDTVDYQTVYSHFKGSVAAPTAGLHFTDSLMKSLKTKIGELTLHVGAGTFKPVKTATIGEHEMHREFFSVNRSLVEDIVKYEGKITAVGTTTVRTLESLYWLGIKLADNPSCNHLGQWECYNMSQELTLSESMRNILSAMDRSSSNVFKASTGIMICPKYRYRVVNNIITNFHQPQSTLLLLVSAAVGDAWKEMYQYALDHDFRFLSYGDSCFIKIK
ncbi:MAG: S-adenosylmethionine:tRNA ribosyltransferase-isomerase [Bacteroidales bacterium]|nr:S-adenosylmethionine:tRNA ribosyltransferase-isomerase [Bacteroidales bacterium]